MDGVPSRYQKELTHDGKRYLLAYGVLAVEPFLLVPMLVAFLKPEEIGILGAIEAILIVLCGFSQLGVKFSYLQHVADCGAARRGRGFWTATLLTAAAGLLLGIIAAVLLDLHFIGSTLGIHPQIGVATMGLLLLLINTQMMLVTDLRAKRNPLPITFSSGTRIAVTLALLPLFLADAAAPIERVLMAQAVGLLVASGLLLAIGRLPAFSGFDVPLARSFVAYGWPIATGSLIKYGTDALLPWLCLWMVSPLAAGALALAARTASLFDTLFGLPFLMAWGGRVYVWIGNTANHAVLPALYTRITVVAFAAGVPVFAVGAGIIAMTGGTSELIGLALWLLPLSITAKILFILRSPASCGFLVTRNMRWNIGYATKGLLAFALLGPAGFQVGGVVGGTAVWVAIEALIVWDMARKGFCCLSQAAVQADGATVQWRVAG